MSERAHQSWWRAAGSPWVLLLSAPIIGTVCFFVLYLVAEASCSPAVGLLDPAVLRSVIILTAALSLVALGGCAWRAGRAWRLGDEACPPTGNAAVENRRFMVFVALLLLTMFAVFVIFLVAPVFGGSVC
jgi:hypothetical protein